MDYVGDEPLPIPVKEHHYAWFSCALAKVVHITGALRFYANYLLFKPSLAGQKKLQIPFNCIISIQKRRTVKLLNNAIRIFTTFGTFLFTSFLSRDVAFYMISSRWEESRAREAEGTHVPDDDSSSDSLTIVEGEQRLSQESPDSSSFPSNPRSSASTRDWTASVPAGLAHRISPSSSFPCPSSKLKVEISTPIHLASVPSPQHFFYAVFSEASNFFTELYAARGYLGCVCGKWRETSPGVGPLHRVLDYEVSLNAVIGPKHTRVKETQRCALITEGGQMKLVFDSFAHSLDVPYTDAFNVVSRWDVSFSQNSNCVVEIRGGAVFTKSVLVRGIIEKACTADLKLVFGLIEPKLSTFPFDSVFTSADHPFTPAPEDPEEIIDTEDTTPKNSPWRTDSESYEQGSPADLGQSPEFRHRNPTGCEKPATIFWSKIACAAMGGEHCKEQKEEERGELWHVMHDLETSFNEFEEEVSTAAESFTRALKQPFANLVSGFKSDKEKDRVFVAF